MKTLVLMLSLLLSVSVWAQERPIAGSTLQSTDTSANSLLVGCVVGSTTCTGGIKAGALAATGLITSTLASDAHGISGGTNGSIIWNVTNTTSDTVALSRVLLTAGTATGGVYVTSQGYTPSGVNEASRAVFHGSGGGGVAIAATSVSGSIAFYAGGATKRFGIDESGDWLIGSSSHVMDSVGTPTLSGCTNCGTSTIAGIDAAMVVSTGTSGGGAQVVNVSFSQTFSNAPACSAGVNTTGITLSVAASTTAVVVTASADFGSTKKVSILCRGY